MFAPRDEKARLLAQAMDRARQQGVSNPDNRKKVETEVKKVETEVKKVETEVKEAETEVEIDIKPVSPVGSNPDVLLQRESEYKQLFDRLGNILDRLAPPKPDPVPQEFDDDSEEEETPEPESTVPIYPTNGKWF